MLSNLQGSSSHRLFLFKFGEVYLLPHAELRRVFPTAPASDEHARIRALAGDGLSLQAAKVSMLCKSKKPHALKAAVQSLFSVAGDAVLSCEGGYLLRKVHRRALAKRKDLQVEINPIEVREKKLDGIKTIGDALHALFFGPKWVTIRTRKGCLSLDSSSYYSPSSPGIVGRAEKLFSKGLHVYHDNTLVESSIDASSTLDQAIDSMAKAIMSKDDKDDKDDFVSGALHTMATHRNALAVDSPVYLVGVLPPLDADVTVLSPDDPANIVVSTILPHQMHASRESVYFDSRRKIFDYEVVTRHSVLMGGRSQNCIGYLTLTRRYRCDPEGPTWQLVRFKMRISHALLKFEDRFLRCLEKDKRFGGFGTSPRQRQLSAVDEGGGEGVNLNDFSCEEIEGEKTHKPSSIQLAALEDDGSGSSPSTNCTGKQHIFQKIASFLSRLWQQICHWWREHIGSWFGGRKKPALPFSDAESSINPASSQPGAEDFDLDLYPLSDGGAPSDISSNLTLSFDKTISRETSFSASRDDGGSDHRARTSYRSDGSSDSRRKTFNPMALTEVSSVVSQGGLLSSDTLLPLRRKQGMSVSRRISQAMGGATPMGSFRALGEKPRPRATEV